MDILYGHTWKQWFACVKSNSMSEVEYLINLLTNIIDDPLIKIIPDHERSNDVTQTEQIVCSIYYYMFRTQKKEIEEFKDLRTKLCSDKINSLIVDIIAKYNSLNKIKNFLTELKKSSNNTGNINISVVGNSVSIEDVHEEME